MYLIIAVHFSLKHWLEDTIKGVWNIEKKTKIHLIDSQTPVYIVCIWQQPYSEHLQCTCNYSWWWLHVYMFSMDKSVKQQKMWQRLNLVLQNPQLVRILLFSNFSSYQNSQTTTNIPQMYIAVNMSWHLQPTLVWK